MNEREIADRLEAYLLKAHDAGELEGAEAETLAPLLEAAERVRRLRAYRLPEARRQRARARLQAAWLAQESAKDTARGLQSWLSWPRAWGHLRGVMAAALAFFLVTMLTLTAVAANDPGSIVYPARVALERVPALLQGQPESRAGAELRAADRRLADLSVHLERTGRPARAAVEALLKGDMAAAAAIAAVDGSAQEVVAGRIATHAAELARLAELAVDPESKMALRSAATEAERLVTLLNRPTAGPAPVAPISDTAQPTVETAAPIPSVTEPPSPGAALPQPTISWPTITPTMMAEITRAAPTLTPDREPPLAPGLRATAGVITPPATVPERRPTVTFTPEPRHTPVPGARATALATVTAIAQTPVPAPSATARSGPGPGRRATALAQTATPLPAMTPTPTTVSATAPPVPTLAATVPPPVNTPAPGRRATAMAQGNTPTPDAVTETPTPEVTP